MLEIRRILVATDFSPASEPAMQFAVDLAERYGASVDLVHVLEDQLYTAVYPDAYFVGLDDLRRQMREDAERNLAEQAKKHAFPEGRSSTYVLAGRPATAIVEHSTASGADLMVVGTHGRGGWAHMVLGSVAERIVRMAPCPVVTVPHKAAMR